MSDLLVGKDELGEGVLVNLRRHFQLPEPPPPPLPPKNKGPNKKKTRIIQETLTTTARATQQHENTTECIWDRRPLF